MVAGNDSSAYVIEASLRLLEVILRFDIPMFMEKFVESGGIQTLLERYDFIPQ